MNDNELASVKRMLAEQEARILIAQQPEFSGDTLLQKVAFQNLVKLAQQSQSPDLVTVESGVKEACKAAVEWRRKKESEFGAVRRPTVKTANDSTNDNNQRSNDPRRNRPAVTVHPTLDADGSPPEEDLSSTAEVLRQMALARGQMNPIVHYGRLPTEE